MTKYSIEWQWHQGMKIETATTQWTTDAGPRAALIKFLKGRMPVVVSATVKDDQGNVVVTYPEAIWSANSPDKLTIKA